MANKDEYISAAKYVVDSIIMYALWKCSQNVSIYTANLIRRRRPTRSIYTSALSANNLRTC